MLTLRADFFGRVLADPRLGQAVDAGQFNVLPMSPEERRAAIEQPALRAGRSFEGGLVERILEAVEGSPGDLPLIEFALTEMWERQTAAGLLTHQAYEAIGEVRGAIAHRADQALARMSPAEQQAVRSIFTRLVRVARPDEGAEDTRRRIALAGLPPEAQAVVKALADARLLVTGRDPASAEETVEVAHEALIRGWQPLQDWLNADREFLLWRQRLDTLAGIWDESGRGEGALLRDALLEEARVRGAGRRDELSAPERAFLEESEAAAGRKRPAAGAGPGAAGCAGSPGACSRSLSWQCWPRPWPASFSSASATPANNRSARSPRWPWKWTCAAQPRRRPSKKGTRPNTRPGGPKRASWPPASNWSWPSRSTTPRWPSCWPARR